MRLPVWFPKLRGSGPSPRVPDARTTGRRGERVAARALRRAGYRILARNVRTPRGEVDVLALDGQILALVEVKTTRSNARGDPSHRLRRVQKQRLGAAGRWLHARSGLRAYPVRHDLVGVILGDGRPQVTIHKGWF